MKAIIGLGNPGIKYKKTRHNIGFMAIDFLQKKMKLQKLNFNKKFNSEISKTSHLLLAKPQTFMNNSGDAVYKILSFYKITSEDLVVIHDDIDLEFGTLRESKNRGSAGHNGVQSIIDKIKTKNFTRFRIGIGKPPQNIPPDIFVLQKFMKENLKELNNCFENIFKKIG